MATMTRFQNKGEHRTITSRWLRSWKGPFTVRRTEMWVVWAMTVAEVFFTDHSCGSHSRSDLLLKSMVCVGMFQ